MQRLALLLLAASCACSTPAPEDRPPDPVFETASGGETLHWRYVPLAASERVRPDPADFARIHSQCAQGSELEDPGRCMARRGFYRAQCSDGRDNDGDGLIDHPDDPGCAEKHATIEDPACDDGLDNDGDGLIDWDGAGIAHPDPQCANTPERDVEAAERSWLRELLPF